MLHRFPFFPQRDAMDCGPACLMMVAASFGRKYPLPYLRERSYLSREGVSAQGIMEAAEGIGFRAMTVKVPFDSGKHAACLMTAPLPCIAHWNQNHFIVVYGISRKSVWIADPAAGKFKLGRDDFEKSWTSDAGQGILILLEPAPEFYRLDAKTGTSETGLAYAMAYLHPYRRLLFQVLIGMALASVFTLILPFLTQSMVDFGIENRNLGFIYLILAAQLMLFFSQMIVQFLQSRILLFVGARVNIAMVNDFLGKLMRLPIGYFDTKMTGDLMQRINDQERVETFLTYSALPTLFSLVNFLVFGFVLVRYNFLIFLIFGVSAALYVGWILFFLRRRKEIDYVRFRQSGENSNTLIELIQGMQEIKLQGSERKRRWIWAGIQSQLFQTNMMSLNLAQWQEAGAGFINQSKNILIAFWSAKLVIEGQMTLGMMLATQYMVGQMDAPLMQFLGLIRAAQDAKISLERINEIKNQPDEDDDRSSSGTGHAHATVIDTFPTPPRGGIVIENLSFRYNTLQSDVLRDINLVIPEGKVTAIVGASGSGKTTLLKILLGFYLPTQGSVRIGNTYLRQLPPSEWRKHCGAVMQDGFIFSDTIANNIAECDEHIDKTRLLHAVEIANIREFIEELPIGYNTKIGTAGNGISSGQHQRLLIARAVYKNPSFLFFDEATNALDANNERMITEKLHHFYREGSRSHNGNAPKTTGGNSKTVVIVAHRLSTVSHADQIIVLDKGHIVESGTHNNLTRLRGAYYNLVKNQLELGA